MTDVEDATKLYDKGVKSRYIGILLLSVVLFYLFKLSTGRTIKNQVIIPLNLSHYKLTKKSALRQPIEIFLTPTARPPTEFLYLSLI